MPGWGLRWWREKVGRFRVWWSELSVSLADTDGVDDLDSFRQGAVCFGALWAKLFGASMEAPIDLAPASDLDDGDSSPFTVFSPTGIESGINPY